MKIKHLVPAVFFAFGLTLAAKAGITNAWYTGGPNDGITINPYSWTGPDTTSLSLSVPFSQTGSSGYINFGVNANSDPAFTMNNSVNNDTGFTWIGYDVQITMSQPFTFSGVNVTLPADWTVGPINGPTGGGPYTGDFLLLAGTPLPTGGVLDFGFTLNFSGPVSFQEVDTPVPAAPEPGTLGLLAVGAAVLGTKVLRRRKA